MAVALQPSMIAMESFGRQSGAKSTGVKSTSKAGKSVKPGTKGKRAQRTQRSSKHSGTAARDAKRQSVKTLSAGSADNAVNPSWILYDVTQHLDQITKAILDTSPRKVEGALRGAVGSADMGSLFSFEPRDADMAAGGHPLHADDVDDNREQPERNAVYLEHKAVMEEAMSRENDTPSSDSIEYQRRRSSTEFHTAELCFAQLHGVVVRVTPQEEDLRMFHNCFGVIVSGAQEDECEVMLCDEPKKTIQVAAKDVHLTLRGPSIAAHDAVTQSGMHGGTFNDDNNPDYTGGQEPKSRQRPANTQGGGHMTPSPFDHGDSAQGAPSSQDFFFHGQHGPSKEDKSNVVVLLHDCTDEKDVNELIEQLNKYAPSSVTSIPQAPTPQLTKPCQLHTSHGDNSFFLRQLLGVY